MYKHIKDITKCNKSINTYSLALKNKNKYNCITIKKDLLINVAPMINADIL